MQTLRAITPALVNELGVLYRQLDELRDIKKQLQDDHRWIASITLRNANKIYINAEGILTFKSNHTGSPIIAEGLKEAAMSFIHDHITRIENRIMQLGGEAP